MTTRLIGSSTRTPGRSLALLSILLATACADLDSVTNPNAPDREAALGDASAAEALIADSFERWHESQYSFLGPSIFLSAASFQHSFSHTGAGCEYYSRIPRMPIVNDAAHVEYDYFTYPWYTLYDALLLAADGLTALGTDPGAAKDLTEMEWSRLRAFARFVQGVSHGSLALIYDRAVIRDETSDVMGPVLVNYRIVLDTALTYLADAASLAEGRSWTIPASWMSVEVSADRLARLAHSYAARLRAAVARTPAERAAVDWRAVIADVDAGIVADWVMDMDPERGWHAAALAYSTWVGWGGETLFIIGMADQSESYQHWLDLPPMDRSPNWDRDGDGVTEPVLIVTPDTRFARGATYGEQEVNPGSIYVIPTWDYRRNLWHRVDFGLWRWSHYWHIDTMPYAYWLDFHWPEVRRAEMDLLRAEALLRRGDPGGAAALINRSRTAAGLGPTDATGTNADCVPRLPDGACGDLMEMLKWEKRLETRFSGLFAAPWYFEGRGWGDLYYGTPLQFPVPCGDLHLLGELPCHTFGGEGGESASPGSVYGWPYEVP